MLSWQHDLEAARRAHDGEPTARFAQLATVDPAGRPRCRTVVVRRVEPDRARVWVTTDARSAKVRHLETTAWVELCWYFAKTREQFRLSGPAELSAGDERLWASLSPAGRRTFFGPAPGVPFDPASSPSPLPAAAQTFAPVHGAQPAHPPAPDTFMGLAVHVEEVDHLVLAEPHRRRRFKRDGEGWTCQRLHP